MTTANVGERAGALHYCFRIIDLVTDGVEPLCAYGATFVELHGWTLLAPRTPKEPKRAHRSTTEALPGWRLWVCWSSCALNNVISDFIADFPRENHAIVSETRATHKISPLERSWLPTFVIRSGIQMQ